MSSPKAEVEPRARGDFRPPELAAIARYTDIASILEVCARTTGMGYCVVAHVTEDRWLACAVLDEIGFGLPTGGELPIKTTLCNEVRLCRAPIAFDHASADPEWREHPTPRTYGLESYIAVPIVLADGEFFGTLCAIDPKPAPATRSDIMRMFELFAKLIANHLDSEKRVAVSEAALMDARQTAELREQFIAVLGHDLRNPLASLLAGVELLKRRLGDSPEMASLLENMDRSTWRMSRLIDDVLDFARGRLGGGLQVAPRPSSDLARLLQELVNELRAAHPETVIEVDMPSRLEVVCDPDRIGQLISNLLANAVAHGDAESPILVSAIVDEAGLSLEVVNGGEPIPEEARPHLFQPFHRGHLTNSRDGLGLGLYIADQIAKAHGGSLSVTSNARETRFIFRMPVRSTAEASPPIPTS